jgi:dihydrofolate synthase / folylpolyglutamate synthase
MGIGDDDAPAHYTPYEQWVRRLYKTNLFHPVKLGLHNIEKLHQVLGNPMDDPKVLVVHIAGTNGKGSVALKMARTLELTRKKKSSGDDDNNGYFKVGLFCSPHVSSFRERMQVNGQLISEEQVVQFLPQIYQLCQEHDIPATFFEITTALAFMFFAANDVDAVVLETGLGGRLDATNVIRNPAIAIITSIGLEHTRILGDTVELIAREKGGIIKPGRPVLVGPNLPDAVLRECAAERQASRYLTIRDVMGDEALQSLSEEELLDYDQENARIARAGLMILQEEFPVTIGTISDDAMREGTSQRPPCRFEHVDCEGGLTVILDVAHNPPAMEYMVRKLTVTYPGRNFRVVVGMSSDKDQKLCGMSILKAVNGDQGRIHLVEAAHPRAAKLEDILVATGLNDANYDLNDRSPTKQIQDAMHRARASDEMLVVCGSVFLMAEAREALGFDEPRDSEYIAEVAGAGYRHGQENFGNAPEPAKAV